ncbi:hypothetical protein [Primorskyibacter sp. S87]
MKHRNGIVARHGIEPESLWLWSTANWPAQKSRPREYVGAALTH